MCNDLSIGNLLTNIVLSQHHIIILISLPFQKLNWWLPFWYISFLNLTLNWCNLESFFSRALVVVIDMYSIPIGFASAHSSSSSSSSSWCLEENWLQKFFLVHFLLQKVVDGFHLFFFFFFYFLKIVLQIYLNISKIVIVRSYVIGA